jgi:hypothetical protein
MNNRIILLRAKIVADIPFNTIVEYLKRRSSRGGRFKLKNIGTTEARLFYAYRDGFYERMGSGGGPTNEIVISNQLTDKGTVSIDFKYPTPVLIAFAIIAIFILALGHFLVPSLGLKGAIITVAVLYLLAVIRLHSQFYYFKLDLEQLEDNYKKGIK